MTDCGFAPVRTLAERQRAHRAFLAKVALFAVGASSSLQIANFTVTALSVVCLLLAPGFLLMKHRGVDLLPLVLAALGWISFLASCLVNDVSVLWPNAVAAGCLRALPSSGSPCSLDARWSRSRPFWQESRSERLASSCSRESNSPIPGVSSTFGSTASPTR